MSGLGQIRATSFQRLDVRLVHMARRIALNAQLNSMHFQFSVNPRLLWNLVRIPVLGILLLLAPAVEFVCGGMLLLGLFVAIAFKISGVGAGFPFWHMVALSLGAVLFAILYHAIIGLLSR
jgi:hypothetical protein